MTFGCFAEFALRSRASRAASATDSVWGDDSCEFAGAVRALARKITDIESTVADRRAPEDFKIFGSLLLTNI